MLIGRVYVKIQIMPASAGRPERYRTYDIVAFGHDAFFAGVMSEREDPSKLSWMGSYDWTPCDRLEEVIANVRGLNENKPSIPWTSRPPVSPYCSIL